MKVKELFEIEERSVSSVMGKQAEHYTGDFYCSNNKLTSLEGAPSSVGGYFYCSNNKLTSLEGAPTRVAGNFLCGINKLTSLRGIHKHIKFVGMYMDFNSNPIKSHVLGLLKIHGLQSVILDNKKVQDILNKHLKGDKDIFACQEELIEAGYPEFAQL